MPQQQVDGLNGWFDSQHSGSTANMHIITSLQSECEDLMLRGLWPGETVWEGAQCKAVDAAGVEAKWACSCRSKSIACRGRASSKQATTQQPQ